MLRASVSLCVLALFATAGVSIAAPTELSNPVQVKEVMGDKSTPKRAPKLDVGAEVTVAARTLAPTPTYHPTKHTYKGAWFDNQPNLGAGEAALEAAFQQQRCHKHPISDFTYVLHNVTHYNFTFWQDWSASDINGTYVC